MSFIKRNRYLTLFLLIVLVGAIFFISPLKQSIFASASDIYLKLTVFNDIINIVNENYVESVDWDEAMTGAYNGLMESLDPHSVYIPQKQISDINEQFTGKFEGIGIEFDILGGYITVIAPISDSPADRVGLQAGDKITEIEGESAYKITKEEVFKKLRGPKGSKVTVTVKRMGVEEPLHFTIIRDEIPIHSVSASFMIDDQTGYILLNRFAANTADEIEVALRELEEQGMKRLILDLRNNSGGYLQQAVNVADKFIPGKQLIVFTKGRKASANQEYYSTNVNTHTIQPLVILVNRGTASASEIVSGAIQDLDRGLIVGETTFGKGLVQRQYSMRDGSAIRVTIARYYTPSGRLIQRSYEKGVEEYYSELADTNWDIAVQQDLEKRPVFHTPMGRTVYGGGGITPDVHVKYKGPYTSTIRTIYHTARPAVEFATWFKTVHKDIVANKQSFMSNYVISDDDLEQFRDILSKNDIKVDEDHFSRDLEYVKRALKAEIARSMWGNDEYYRVKMLGDNQVQKALQVFDQAGKLIAGKY